LFHAVDSAYARHDLARLHQGDILRDLKIIERAEASSAGVEIAERQLPYCIVLTQDCDLEQDHGNRLNQNVESEDKYLQSVLLCPAYPAESLRQGTHLNDLKLRMMRFSSKPWGLVKNNNNPRYHFLNSEIEIQVPELVLDFKHYFTISRGMITSDIIELHYLATLAALFRENVSARFANYLSRIGLPNISPQQIEG